MKFKISANSIERLQERFPSLSNSMPEIANWRRGDSFSPVKRCFADMMSYAEENKSHINDSKKMIYYYDKYGYDKEYVFMELRREDLVFVLKKDRIEDEYTVATVFYQKFDNNIKNKKYKGVRRKEDIEHEMRMKEINQSVTPNFEKFRNLSLIDFGINPNGKKEKKVFF